MTSEQRYFELHHCIGRGGFGEVYQATMISPGGLRTTVAVKVLRADRQVGGDAAARLRDECRILARMRHPALLEVHDLATLDGRLSMVTEFVDGSDVDVCWSGPDPLPTRCLLEVLSCVASGLAAAGEATAPSGLPLCLVHRDVKPRNIRIGRHGEVKLLDFGIAHAQALEREAETESDVLVGSLPYMAPERFRSRLVRPHVDVFSLGCVLYEGLQGSVLFGRESVRTLGRMAHDAGIYEAFLAERLATLAVAPSVYGLLSRMLAHEPEHRPGHSEVAERCEALADQHPGPSLRLWSTARAWPPQTVVPGTLSGRRLADQPVHAAEPLQSANPRIVRQPVITVDPAVEPGVPTTYEELAPRVQPRRLWQASSVSPAPPSQGSRLSAVHGVWFGCLLLLLLAGLFLSLAMAALKG